MTCAGIDVHKSFLQVAAVGGGTLLPSERVGSDHGSVAGFFMSPRFTRAQRGSMRCVMESSSVRCVLFRYMTDRPGLDMVLSSPYQTKAIAASKRKTDRVDAAMLADLHRGGHMAECHVPDGETVGNRRLVRYRKALVESRTRHRNMIHGILLQAGIRMRGGAFSKDNTGRLWDGGLQDRLVPRHDRLVQPQDQGSRRGGGNRAGAPHAASLLMSIPVSAATRRLSWWPGQETCRGLPTSTGCARTRASSRRFAAPRTRYTTAG